MEYECEICGRKTSNPYIAYIAGAQVILCERCARKYKNAEPLLKRNRESKGKKRKERGVERKKKVVEKTVEIVEDYAKKIREAREKRGMKVEELAKAVAEPESEMHKIERGELVPEIKVAQKLEKFLGIKITREVTEEDLEKEEEQAKEFVEKRKPEITLGDIVIIKKKKK